MVGAALLKFGNPVIFAALIGPPESWDQFFVGPWPISWSFVFVAVLTVASLALWRWPAGVPKWLAALPSAWLMWQLIASTATIDPTLTRLTILHFAGCVACFYVGLFALGRLSWMPLFWVFVGAGFLRVLWLGLGQYYGGLEGTRTLLYEQGGWDSLPLEFRRRLTGGRIFSTLVYPNALAGVILFFLPVLSIALWRLTDRLPAVARKVVCGFVIYVGLASLYWTKSKSGLLIGLGLAAIGLLHAPVPTRVKRIFAITLVIAGCAGIYLKFSEYFGRGAPSVVARFDYWKAAVQGALEHPLVGSGPGTFALTYKRLKSPESEMARLAHNDYLEQACDSGIPGALVYSAMILGILAATYKRSFQVDRGLGFVVWLALLGWAIQGCVEFGLYIPGLSWPFFLLSGWLLAAR